MAVYSDEYLDSGRLPRAGMAVYSEKYLDPVQDYDKVKSELSKDDPLSYQSIKAATPYNLLSPDFDPVLEKFINTLMKNGRRAACHRVMDHTFEHIKYIQLEKYHKLETEEAKDSIEVKPSVIFHEAVRNCTPLLGTQKSLRAGINYTVPIPLSDKNAQFRAFKFILDTVRTKQPTTPMHEALAQELINASKNEGSAVRKKQDLHRTCEQNKQYADFKW